MPLFLHIFIWCLYCSHVCFVIDWHKDKHCILRQNRILGVGKVWMFIHCA
ncbi:hypothetical protein AAZX31_20G122500 [Glycine max]